MTNTPSEWDLIVIGAGIYGIQAARTYLELHPAKRIVVLEADSSIGGVWSNGRVYDDFWTQTPLGLLEFSDLPMHAIPQEGQHYGFFKAHHVASYLEEYCESRLYNGASLRSRIQTGESVYSLTKADGVWRAATKTGRTYCSPLVIDASGLTSIPKYPDLPCRDSFKGNVFHHKDFANWARHLKEGTSKKIVVIGGAKSAADVAYGCAKSKHDVTWLIGLSGSGPAAFVSAKGSMGYANSNESFYTRMTSLFLVSLFSLAGGYSMLLKMVNITSLGKRMLRRIWQGINDKARKEADYDRADGQANGFCNLKPDTELFWQNDSTGIIQRADFFDTIAAKVKVVREDLSHLSEHGIVIDSGEVLRADVIVCATGWKINHPYVNQRLAAELGLPVPIQAFSSDQKAHFDKLDHVADREVISTFPVLDSDWAYSNNKSLPNEKEQTAPFRLWKSIVPIDDQSILFVGKLMLGNHFRAAEVQALFACGVLDGSVHLPPKDEMETDVSKTVAWCRRRYLKKGSLGHWFYWDMVPYTDMVLAELGLSSHRSKSWWNDLVKPCYARDLASLVNEYKNKLDKD